MYCPHCGKQINEDSAFCRFCGRKIEPIVQDGGARDAQADPEAAKTQVIPAAGGNLPAESPDAATEKTQAMPAVDGGMQAGASEAATEKTQAMPAVPAAPAGTAPMQPLQAPVGQPEAQASANPQGPQEPPAEPKNGSKTTIIMLVAAGVLFVALIAAGIFFATGGELPFGNGKNDAPKAEFTNGRPPAQSSSQNDSRDPSSREPEAPQATGGTSSSTAGQASQGADAQASVQTSAESQLYSEIAGKSFTFSSGAGAWGTTLTVNEDGSFYGSYSDTDMGATGDQNPNGTVYYCDFNGQLGAPSQVDELTYSAPVVSFSCTPQGDSHVQNGILFQSAPAAGMIVANTLSFYLPGKSATSLPRDFVTWTSLMWSGDGSTLPGYGIYNPDTQAGFYCADATWSGPYEEGTSTTSGY